MAVLNVKEDWRERTAEESTDGASATRVYTVEFDEADDVAKRPLMALYATGIPRRYQVHPYNPWLYVRNKTVKTSSLCLYEVTVNYDVQSSIDRGNDSDPFLNPLDEEPEISWTFEVTNEQINLDLDGKPIMNTACEIFDPPITEDFYDLVLRIERNQANYDCALAAMMIGTVNGASFLEFGAGLVRCTVFSGQKARKANLVYWRVAYEFKIRYQFWGDYMGGTSENIGWNRKILNAGWRQAVDEKLLTIYDDEGSPVSQPWPLDANGQKLPKTAVDAGNLHWLNFRTCRVTDFSVLGL